MTKHIRRQVLRMGLGIALLGLIECLVLFFIRGQLMKIIIGAAVGCLTAWLYFFILAAAVEQPQMRGRYLFLYLLRFAAIAVMAYWVLTDQRVDALAAILPLIFPRLLILLRARRGQL